MNDNGNQPKLNGVSENYAKIMRLGEDGIPGDFYCILKSQNPRKTFPISLFILAGTRQEKLSFDQ